MPEILTRKNYPRIEPVEKLYCYCKRPMVLPMIYCQGENCENEWFHHACVGINDAPEEKWFCRNCISEENIEES